MKHWFKHLDGTNALAICKDDATAPARIIAKFAKTAPKLELIAGVVEGSYYDKAGITALSESLPEKYFWEDCLDPCSPRSQTLHALSNRSQKKEA